MKDIIENFDRAAEKYELHAGPQDLVDETMAQWILPEERKGNALEFGAGTGLFTRQMLPWAGTYLATDAAPKMVALGHQHCPEAKWQVWDARAPTSLGQMDWIFACCLLQWLPDPQKILKNWKKILKPHGRLAIAVLLPGTLGELQSILPEAKPLDWHSALEWRGMVECVGFALEREQTWEHHSVHSNSLELLRAVHAMGLAPRQAVGPGRLRAALRTYNEKHVAPGGVRATWRAWLARAQAT
jgi:trans-aconitate methyltransferase